MLIIYLSLLWGNKKKRISPYGVVIIINIEFSSVFLFTDDPWHIKDFFFKSQYFVNLILVSRANKGN